MTSSHCSIQAVVFDWAGTLIDFGCCAPLQTFMDVFADQGVEVTDEEARRPMGMAKREHLRTMADMPRIAEAWKQHHGEACSDGDIDRMYEAFLPIQVEAVRRKCDLIPGAVEIVTQLRRRGVRVGSSTGYNKQLATICIDAAKRSGLEVDAAICAEDVPAGRPMPWMIFENMKRLDVYPPLSVIKVDDTTTGLEAARNAGCWAVGVSLSGNMTGLDRAAFEACESHVVDAYRRTASEKMVQAGAHFVIDSVADLPSVIERINQAFADGLCPTTLEPVEQVVR